MSSNNRCVAISSAIGVGLLLTGSSFVAPPSGALLPGRLQNVVGQSALQSGDVSSSTMPIGKTSLGSFGSAAWLMSAAVVAGVSRRAAQPQKTDQIRSSVSMAAFETELGVQAPIGFWDPMGYTADGNVAAFKRRRSVELKHGRICMMAASGYIHPEIAGKWPGFCSPSLGLKFDDIPNGLGALSKMPVAGLAQIVAFSGFIELAQGFDDYKTGTPGDYGWKTLTAADPNERRKKLSAEIANGRLGMMAIIGMFFQDGLTGSAWGDWSLYKLSPLR